MRSEAEPPTAECSETDPLLGAHQEAFQSVESLHENCGFSKPSASTALDSYENLLPSLGALEPFFPHKLWSDTVRGDSKAVFKTSLAVACNGFCRITLEHTNGDLLPGDL